MAVFAIAPVPTAHAALKVTGANEVAVTDEAPLPMLEASDILVRVACVAINPVDGKSAEMSPSVGATSGTDFSGVVAALGSAVRHDGFRASCGLKPLAIGDRVMGFVFGNNPLRRDNGAFAEYVAVPARLVWHVPADMDLVSAATLPAAVATTGLSLFHALQLPLPSGAATPAARDAHVFVYGGGTATGAMAIQVLKLAGYAPITACSPASAARAKQLGAAATFDYNSPTCGSDVLEHTSGALSLALDCISDTGSMGICYEALGPAGGRYVALDAFPLRGHTRRSVVPDWICAHTQFGEAVDWAPPYNLDPSPEDRRFAESWYAVAQQLLDGGGIAPPPTERRTGGLAAVAEGMNDVRKGTIRGRKLAYPINEVLCAA